MPAAPGTASIAPDTVSPPAAAASESRDSLASSGAKVGVRDRRRCGGKLALLVGDAEQTRDRVLGVLPTLAMSEGMRPNMVPMPLNVSLDRLHRIGDQAARCI